MELKKIFKIILIICFILIIIDQSSKILINKFIQDDVKIIPNNILTITKVENEGIAFGLNKRNLGNIALNIIVLIISQKDNMTKSIIIFLSLILAGGISNVIDRIFKGAVFDFIKIGEFPVFNFADIFIVFGWILFVIDFIKYTSIEIAMLKNSSKDNK